MADPIAATSSTRGNYPGEVAEIPAGQFTFLGSAYVGTDMYTQHPDTRVSAFVMAKTEVTIDQYTGFANRTGRQDALPSVLSWPENHHPGNYPIGKVPYSDRLAFCAAYTVNGQPGRLPTIEEMQYVAVGTYQQELYGSPIEGAALWHQGSKTPGKQPACGEGREDERTIDDSGENFQPTGSTENSYGVCDLAGNVSEMTVNPGLNGSTDFGEATVGMTGGNEDTDYRNAGARNYTVLDQEELVQSYANFGWRCVWDIPSE